MSSFFLIEKKSILTIFFSLYLKKKRVSNWNSFAQNCTHLFSYCPEIGFPFAKLLRNFCGTKRKIFLSLRISFARKKTTICAIIRKSHFAQNCPIPLLRNSSFAQFCNQSFSQFRNFVKIKRLVTTCVFLRIQSGKILFWNVFLLVTFT